MRLFHTLMLTITVLMSSKSFAISDRFWGYCSNGLAYSDEAMTVRKPETDKVCQLPDAYALGETNVAAIRCSTLQQDECQVGAGGNPDSLGDHNVPRGAFFLQRNPNPDETGGIAQMRCMCGCFTPDVVIDSTKGAKTILELFEISKMEPFRMITPDDMFAAEFNVSPWLNNGNFTVGPEDKPVLKFATEGGYSVTVTEKHPMVVVVSGEYELRLAREIKVGDTFVAKDGSTRPVTKIESFALSSENNLVYNVDTKGQRPIDHIITANGILLGDLYLQNLLSERAQRVENIQQPE